LRYKLGEIDIIVEDGEDLIFVEVRFRSGATRGEAAESVSEKKRKRFIRAAQKWLQQHISYQNHYCRFDLVAINSVIDIKHTDWKKMYFKRLGLANEVPSWMKPY
jgi:putative endonuclease|tara:strand:- start:115511 stop:115825 length:315 start_codon:yes stop_codon:yes gene_type:complete